MKDIDQLLGESELFAGLPADDLRFIAACATHQRFAAGELLFAEGDSADRFYVVRQGRVGFELEVPGRGTLLVDAAEAGEAAGVSWLFPPYRWNLTARAVEPVAAMGFDARCLRDKCDAEPRLGYALMQRFASLMARRLSSARLRLIDVYGHAAHV